MLTFMVVQFPGLKGLFPTGSSPMKILSRSKEVVLIFRYSLSIECFLQPVTFF